MSSDAHATIRFLFSTQDGGFRGTLRFLLTKRAWPLILQVSRPGCYQFTVWFYMLPFTPSMLRTAPFWIGLFYVTVPMNLLVYAGNDIMDVATDAVNPRKGGAWFGARAGRMDLYHLCRVGLIMQIPFLLYFGVTTGFPRIIAWIVATIAVNVAYNQWPKFSDKPPFDLIFPLGYLLTIGFSIIANQTSALPFRTYLHAASLVIRVQVLTEFLDVCCDESCQRKTTCVLLGQERSYMLLVALHALEIQLHGFLFMHDNPLLFFFSIACFLQIVSNHPVWRPAGAVLWLLSGIYGWTTGAFIS